MFEQLEDCVCPQGMKYLVQTQLWDFSLAGTVNYMPTQRLLSILRRLWG